MERQAKILVIDDEQIVLDSVCKNLRKENYELVCVLSAPEAIQQMEHTKFDVVITDLMMPEIDGLELMKLIKDRCPTMPVVMITGYATINTALQATQLGAFDYIAKPFSRAELKSVIKRAVELALAEADRSAGQGEAEAEAATGGALVGDYRSIGDNCWMMLERDGKVLLGVNHSFLNTIGRIQTIHLPDKGNELRQGSVYLQIFTTDMRSHPVLSPLSGLVVDVNEDVLNDPAALIDDPYGGGWLIRLSPSKFESEIRVLGL